MSTPGSSPPDPQPNAMPSGTPVDGGAVIEPPASPESPQYGIPQHGSEQYGSQQHGSQQYGYGSAVPPGGPGYTGGWAPGYQPGYAVPYQRTNGLAVASLVTGIASIFTCWLGLLVGAAAVVLGIVSLNQIKNDTTQQGKGLAIAGIVCGGFGLLIQVLWIAIGIGLFALGSFLEPPPPG